MHCRNTIEALGWSEMRAMISQKQHGLDFAHRCMIKKDMEVTYGRRTGFCFLIQFNVYLTRLSYINVLSTKHSNFSNGQHYSIWPIVAEPLTA
jgi:hypothetical protein